MDFETALTRLLDIQYPLLLAPMGGVAGGVLARAVTEAGGLGSIGVGYQGVDFIERELSLAKEARVGIGFITWDLAGSSERLDVALAHRPALLQLSFGDAAPFVSRIARAGVKLALQVQSVSDAKRAVDLGASIVIAQGTEAGGHGAARALFPLLPAIVDAVTPTPVVAAGGIADGRGLLAALALGASGVLIGTRFIAATEALAAAEAKAKVVTSSGDSTLRTRVFDIVRGLAWPEPYTGRALRNRFTHEWHGREAQLSAALDEESSRYAAAAERNDLETALVWAGEGVDLIRRIEPAAAIIQDIIGQATAGLSDLNALLG